MTKNDELVERIAEALWAADGYNPSLWGEPWSPQWIAHMEKQRPIYRDKARALMPALFVEMKAAFIDGWEYGNLDEFGNNTKEADWIDSDTIRTVLAHGGEIEADASED